MSNQARKPDVEFKRQIAPGTYRVYGHIYWKPFIVHVRGRTIIGKKHLKKRTQYESEEVR